MKKNTFIAALIFSSLAFASCGYGLDEFLYRANAVSARAAELYKIPEPQVPKVPSDGKYSILVITDVHFGAESEEKKRMDSDFLLEISELSEKPLFAVCLGDVAERGLEKEFVAYDNEIIKKLSAMGIKTFNVVGNHDLYNSGWRWYSKYTYPYTSFYHFNCGIFSCYFIDSAGMTLGNNQFRALEKAFRGDPNPKFVFTHIPIYCNDEFYFSMQNTTERNKIIALFSKNDVRALCCGHIHDETVSYPGKFTEYTFGGYFAHRAWALLHVDEKSESFSVELRRIKDHH